MKGDKIKVIVDVGGGKTAEFITEATKRGRNVQAATQRNALEVTEETGSGRVIRTSRFANDRVVALIEDPNQAGAEEDSE